MSDYQYYGQCLIAYSTSGLVGLMYARHYPHKVSSLGLLAVGSPSAINWQAHIIRIFQLFPGLANKF